MRVFIIPHFHYDTEWVRTKEEFAKIAVDNIEEALRIMDNDEEFRFVIDQAILFDHFKKLKPSLWNKFITRIKEGKIELICGMYVMPDTLLPGLESEIRQILYAKPFMEELSGKEIKIGWMIDCFGHHFQTPQIFKKAGYDYYFFKRGYRGKSTMNFIWEGLDGSRIFVHYMILGYDPLVLPEDVESGAELLLKKVEEAKKYALNDCIMLMVGSDMTKPNPALSKIVQRAREIKGKQNLRTCRLPQYTCFLYSGSGNTA